MVATFNGWDEMAEAEREALEQWEEAQKSMDDGTTPVPSRREAKRGQRHYL